MKWRVATEEERGAQCPRCMGALVPDCDDIVIEKSGVAYCSEACALGRYTSPRLPVVTEWEEVDG